MKTEDKKFSLRPRDGNGVTDQKQKNYKTKTTDYLRRAD